MTPTAAVRREPEGTGPHAGWYAAGNAADDMSVELPTVTITSSALRAFRAAAKAGDSEAGIVLHLTIDAHFQNELFFAPPEDGDVVVTASGLTMAMDARTARRAHGLTIDYVEGVTGAGFKLENPNENPPVKGICPADVVAMLERGEDLELVDVRRADERSKAFVAASRWLDERYERELLARRKTAKLVFMAHHSRGGIAAAQRFFDRGFTNVWYVVGGIDGWSTMDPSVPRY